MEENTNTKPTEVTITLPIYPILKYDPISKEELNSVLDDFCTGFKSLQTEYKYHTLNSIVAFTDIKDSFLKEFEVIINVGFL